jgi:hypothetical protein
MTDEQVNEAIFRKHGGDFCEECGEWVNFDGDGYPAPPDYTHSWELCGELLEEMVVADVTLIAHEKSAWCVNWWDADGLHEIEGDNPKRLICEAWLPWRGK